jgi:tetratricopeptide (TPR) repeat protein
MTIVLSFSSSAAHADDKSDCIDWRGMADSRLAACNRAISSGQWKGSDLALLLYGRGNAFSNKEDHDHAISDLSEAIRLNPKYVDAFIARGVSYARKSDQDRAILDYSEAIRLDPKNMNAFFNRAGAYAEKGDYDRAIFNYSEAIRLNPEDGVTFYHRGNTHARKGDYDRAVLDYSEAIRYDPNWADATSARDAAIKTRDALRSAKVEPSSPPSPSPRTSPASGKRVALVMGNGAYKNVPQLQNTITDARTMRDVLKKLNFEVVYGEDLDKRAMGRLFGEFGSIVDDAEAAIVYFAGHGSTFADIPYVVPIDSDYKDLNKIPSELVQVESLVGGLRRAKGVRLAVLDACRDNEREIQLKREEAARLGETKRGGSVSQGLAPLKNANGLIVVYSTQYMTTAADGAVGGNSPFTGALARYMVSPKMDIKDVLFRAGQEVISKTGGTQRPEISISLFEPFMLVE